jgi:hypothetical protein
LWAHEFPGCGDWPHQQRDAAIKDLGVAPASYDKMYAGYASDFKKKWGTMTPAKQKSTCDQMKR